MIDPALLAFDIDGVIADTMHLFLDILRDHYDVHTVKYADITCYRLDHCLDLDEDVLEGAVGRILDGRYRASLKPFPDAGPVLRRIGETTGRILMVTARPEPGPIEGWLNRLLDGQHHRARIVATGSFEAKTDVLLENGIKWFVEDRLETCHLLKAAGIEPVVFSQPWNQEPHDFLHVGSWMELEQRIAFR
ncbi:haloacid dehalogenase [uncultured Desulfosarcina sp.]|uniref:5' nucleotidase, NT5C type n=1 Tax=uncultured Desulfosarcina sp. TaxID=218289 RepID=UPI0029C65800|nr:haloacid dehalogenase [uncultured Desulfosarcina sp.]